MKFTRTDLDEIRSSDRKAFLATVAEAFRVTITPAAETIDPTDRVLDEVYAERGAQDAKWGEQNHPNGTGQFPEVIEADAARFACQNAADGGYLDWLHILREEVAEAFAEPDPAKLRVELVQVAAVAAAWVECIDRREANPAAAGTACDRGYPLSGSVHVGASRVVWCERKGGHLGTHEGYHPRFGQYDFTTSGSVSRSQFDADGNFIDRSSAQAVARG